MILAYNVDPDKWVSLNETETFAVRRYWYTEKYEWWVQIVPGTTMGTSSQGYKSKLRIQYAPRDNHPRYVYRDFPK